MNVLTMYGLQTLLYEPPPPLSMFVRPALTVVNGYGKGQIGSNKEMDVLSYTLFMEHPYHCISRIF